MMWAQPASPAEARPSSNQRPHQSMPQPVTMENYSISSAARTPIPPVAPTLSSLSPLPISRTNPRISSLPSLSLPVSPVSPTRPSRPMSLVVAGLSPCALRTYRPFSANDAQQRSIRHCSARLVARLHSVDLHQVPQTRPRLCQNDGKKKKCDRFRV